MDFLFSSVGILIHDCNNRPFLGEYDSTCSDYWDLIDLVIVNPLYVHTSTNLGNNPDIVSCNPTTGCFVNESTFELIGLNGWDILCHRQWIDLSVDNPIHIDLMGLFIGKLFEYVICSW